MKIILITLGLLLLTNCQTTDAKCVKENDNACMTNNKSTVDSENLYLEEVYGKEALAWVEKQNKARLSTFENDPRYQGLKESALKILNDPNKLIQVSFQGDWAYNFWQDEKSVRGIWRRTPIVSYLKGERDWEVLLDIDELAKKENKNWVFDGSQRYKNKALVNLSLGGKDANVTREFDMDTKSFVTNGFNLPEGKNSLTWINENEVFLGLALKDTEVTDSGYPKQVRLWKRGEFYQSAKIIFTAEKKDIWTGGFVSREQEDGPARYKFYGRALDFFNAEHFLIRDDGSHVKLDLPTDAELEVDDDQLFLTLKSNWKFRDQSYKVGSLLKIDIQNFINGSSDIEVVFQPTKSQFLQQKLIHNHRVFLVLSKDVTSLVVEAVASGKTWRLKKLNLPKNNTIEFSAHSKKNDIITFSSEGFTNPKTIFKLNLANDKLEVIDNAPSYFDSRLYTVKQNFTVSKDGTRVPYYVVHKKNLKLNGKNPTVINAYGGFEISRTPNYSPIVEASWLKEGGVWIVGNIRGGGEYGPEWHTSAKKQNRQRAFDDFFAIAEDVIRKKITSAQHLGIVGGSNGGLLMGVAMTQRPELYNAIAIQVPLLDMLRYHKLLAGASWVGEYGDPEDPKMRPILEGYSPYHNLKPDGKYPEVFFMTSTADDRVHPGHARRMAAKMDEYRHPFFYYENTEGGHGGSANNAQRAKWSALQYTYFLQKLKTN